MLLPLLEAGDMLTQAVPGRWRILRGAHLWLIKLSAEAPLWVLMVRTASGGAAEGLLILMAPALAMSIILWLRLRSLSRYRFLVSETALQNRLAEELSNSSSPVAFMELLDAFFSVPRGGCAMLSRHSSGREWLCWTGEGQTVMPEETVTSPPSWSEISPLGLRGRDGTAAGLSRARDWFLFVPSGFALAEMEPPLRNNLMSIVSHAWRAVGHSTAIDEAFIAAAMMLARLADSKDDYTHGHSVRVSRLCRRLGREMGLPDQMVRTLGVGALLHDLGKVAIPLEILTKRGLLTREERMVIERHPVEGERILDALSGYEEVRGIVRSHHERLDGNGYPAGLSGRAIPLLARIVAVADTFDAITSRRSYRADSDERTALHAIRAGSGTQFDARVVEAFGRILAGEGVIGPDE
jgi:putative nucleotidyltransferase with HDIG domain